MSYDDRLGDYNDVASRMREFFDRYPDGRLRPNSPWRVQTIGDKAFIVFEAAAYRSGDDPNPGIGTAWEPFPGRTPYTRDSELMNAETSAWGRAILAVGAADTKKGIASREEVRNRQADQDQWQAAAPARPTPPEDPAQRDRKVKRMYALWRELGYAGDENRAQRHQIMTKILKREITSTNDLTTVDVGVVVDALYDRAKEVKQQRRTAE